MTSENDKKYHAPKLDHFGTMAELTAAGSGVMQEQGQGMSPVQRP